ncbi:hypothetical protein B7494_g5856 [Chlorociboria aeruginascens]|nr:hypothetical protein B7494_g5856 [Chlorociboria aeruginascens]
MATGTQDETPDGRTAEESSALLTPNDSPNAMAPPPPFKLTRIAVYCMLLLFLVEMYDFITIAPLVALFERSICRSYYVLHSPEVIRPDGSIEESLCKINPIQAELAVLRGWKLAFDTLPVFLVAVLFGKLADRVGRKIVLFLTVVGLIGGTLWILLVCRFYNVFPLRLVWLASAFYLCGGGLFSAMAIVFSMAADACSEADRSRTFYYIYSSYLVTQLLGPWLASVTMDISLWIPMFLSIAFLLLTFPVMAIMPETHTHKTHSESDDGIRYQNLAQNDDNIDSEHIQDFPPESLTARKSMKDALRTKNIILAAPIFLVGLLRPATLNVLLQYTSVRFSWKLSRAVVIVSEVAAVNLLLFLFILPRSLAYIRKHYQTPPQVIDLKVLRISIVLLGAGALLIGLAPNIAMLITSVVVFAAGFGIRISMLSLVTSWVDEDLRGRLYGIIQIVENVGLLIWEPILENIFAASFQLPRFWLATPFFVASAIYFLVSLCAMFIRLDRPLYTLIISQHPENEIKTVNELIISLRRTRINTLSDQSNVTSSTIQPTLPPHLRNLLSHPETQSPAPRARDRRRFDVNGSRLPAGPPPPRSWVEMSPNLSPGRKNISNKRLYPHDVGHLPGSRFGDRDGKPKGRRLQDMCMREMARNWEFMKEYEKNNLADLPVGIRMELLSYIAVYGPEEGVGIDGLRNLLVAPRLEDEEVTVERDNEDFFRLDLSGSVGRSITFKNLVEIIRQSTPTISEQTTLLWDEAVSIPVPLSAHILHLTHLSLSHPPASISWSRLLGFSKHIPILTHLSLAYWPTPSMAHNSKSTSLTHASDYYSKSVDNDDGEASAILRRLAQTLYCLEYLDLTGCGEWWLALLGTIPDTTLLTWKKESDDGGVDWQYMWKRLGVLVLGVCPGREKKILKFLKEHLPKRLDIRGQIPTERETAIVAGRY